MCLTNTNALLLTIFISWYLLSPELINTCLSHFSINPTSGGIIYLGCQNDNSPEVFLIIENESVKLRPISDMGAEKYVVNITDSIIRSTIQLRVSADVEPTLAPGRLCFPLFQGKPQTGIVYILSFEYRLNLGGISTTGESVQFYELTYYRYLTLVYESISSESIKHIHVYLQSSCTYNIKISVVIIIYCKELIVVIEVINARIALNFVLQVFDIQFLCCCHKCCSCYYVVGHIYCKHLSEIHPFICRCCNACLYIMSNAIVPQIYNQMYM